ncbi:MAG: hypothetical protein SWN98_11650 [Pseudomonadota bacterium]|nr:hypothetical protein [Pseudomonadota bacterium]
MGNRLGLYADKIEAIREQRGLTSAGFRQDGSDDAGEDKEAALAELYYRADAHLPSGIGGTPPSDAADTEDEKAP